MFAHKDFIANNPTINGPVVVLQGSVPDGYLISLENFDDVPFVYKFQSSPDGNTWTDQQLWNGSGSLSTTFSIAPGTCHNIKIVPANAMIRLYGEGGGGVLAVSINYRVSQPTDGTLITLIP